MKKKSLLLAIAAMSMAAVGVGTVGTFAWYQVGAQLNGSTSHAAEADVTVTANSSADIAYTVEMHMVAEHVGSLNLYLSTWNTDHLETKIRNSQGTAVVDPNFTVGTTGELVSVYKISLYITNPGNPSGGTNEEWASLVAASGLKTTYNFAYKDIHTGTEIDIGSTNLPFYYVAKTSGAADAYDHSKEVAAEPVKSFETPTVATLKDTTSVSTYQVGYLYVRAEGSNTNHDRTKVYKGGVEATAANLA